MAWLRYTLAENQTRLILSVSSGLLSHRGPSHGLFQKPAAVLKRSLGPSARPLSRAHYPTLDLPTPSGGLPCAGAARSSASSRLWPRPASPPVLDLEPELGCDHHPVADRGEG